MVVLTRRVHGEAQSNFSPFMSFYYLTQEVSYLKFFIRCLSSQTKITPLSTKGVCRYKLNSK